MANGIKDLHGNWVNDRLALLDPSWTPDTARALKRLRERRRDRRTAGPILSLGWSLAAGIGSLCLMVAFPAPRAAAQYCLNCSIALWQNFAAAKPVSPHLDPLSARKPAPDFVRKDASGRRVQLSSLRGKVVLLNFWATWCGGCKVEIPWLVEFQRTYGRRGLDVLGVSFDEDGWKAVTPFIAQKHLNYPVMIADSHFAGLYGGVDALPMTYVIDKAGRIAARHLGVIDKSQYQAEIEKLISEP
jgi:peroxiredoxin